MYERNGYDWKVLGTAWGGDPIPGSPDVLVECAASFSSSAGNLGRAVDNLTRLQSTDDTCSEAVAAIMAKAVATAGTLAQVRLRYDTISQALTSYAPELREAQRMSVQAVTQATEAVRRRNAAKARNDDARLRSLTVDQAARDAAMEDYYSSKADFEYADGDVQSAKALLSQAISKRNEAGTSAKNTIKGNIDGSSLNDTVGDYLSAAWEKISTFVTDMATWIWDHIDEISLVLTILGAVFPPLAAVAAAARLLTYVKLGVNLLQGVATGIRTGNWNDAIKAGITIGITLVTLKAGSWLSGKAKGWVTRTVNTHNYNLRVDTQGKVNVILDKTLRNVEFKQLKAVVAENRVLPWYHPGSSTVLNLQTSLNPAAKESWQQVNGALSLMKGSDYKVIQATVQQLDDLASKAPISAEATDAMAKYAGQAAERAVQEGAGYVKSHLDSWFPSPAHEAPGDQTASAQGSTRYRVEQVTR